jgi:hypothetical protein
MTREGIVKLDNQRSYLEWVDISDIAPNPLNPRKNDAVKSEDLGQVIKNRGWEIPITAYKKGSIFVVLSGHRRLFAARKAGMKQIPVYVVPAPKSIQEEIQRIADAQAHQVDWDTYEWAKYVYERWIAWGKPSFHKFATDIRLAKRAVEQYCQVLDFFPTEEVEAGLRNKTYSIYNLHYIFLWVRDIKKLFPDLVEKLGEDLIRRSFLAKLETKKIHKEALKKREYLQKAKESDLKEFFMQPELSLEEIMVRAEFDVNEKTFQGKLISMGYAKKNIRGMLPKNKIEAKKAAQTLAEMQEVIMNQIKEIERNYPDVIEKEDLFTWKKKK